MNESEVARERVNHLRAELESEICRLNWLTSKVESVPSHILIGSEYHIAVWRVQELRAALEYELRRYFRSKLNEMVAKAASPSRPGNSLSEEEFWSKVLEKCQKRTLRYQCEFERIMQYATDVERVLEKERLQKQRQEAARQRELMREKSGQRQGYRM